MSSLRTPVSYYTKLKSLLNFDYGLLAVYFCGLHRILFKGNSPYGKSKFGSFLFWCALRSFFPLTCFPSIPVAVTVILHFFFLCSLSNRLACQGDCSRCYSMSKLPQLLYTFYSRCKPNPSATPLPCSLEIPFPFWDGICCFPVFLLLPYNLQNGDPPFYLIAKAHTQIQLNSCSEGFCPHLKERFLHFNKRRI